MRISKAFTKTISYILIGMLALACVGCGAMTKKSSGVAEPQNETGEKIDEPIAIPNISEGLPGDINSDKINLTKDVTISFIGDYATDHFFKDNYDKAGIEGVVSPDLLKLFRGSDLFVANHEYCATDISDDNKLTYQTWIEHVPTENEAMLTELGLDMVSVANNHAFDYGLQGFLDTMDTLDSLGIKYVGGGHNVDEAVSPVIYEVGKKKIAFFSASSLLTERALAEWTARENQAGISVLFPWYDTYPLMEEKIKAIREEVDVIVAITHWGVEGNHMFNGEEQNFAHMLIDLGVDVIIGGHAHVVQGVEYYNNGVVFYGLGNFLFAPEPIDTMVVSMTISRNGELSFEITPCKSAYYYVQPATDSTVYDIINNNSVNARVSSDGKVSRVD